MIYQPTLQQCQGETEQLQAAAKAAAANATHKDRQVGRIWGGTSATQREAQRNLRKF